MGYSRSKSHGLPEDASRKAIAETSAFLSWALAKERGLARIPRRRVDDGGFAQMMRSPFAKRLVAHWWARAIERIRD